MSQLNPNKLNLDAPTDQMTHPNTNMRHHSDKISVMSDPFQRPSTLIAPRVDNNQDLIHVSDNSASNLGSKSGNLGNTDTFSINKDLDNIEQNEDLLDPSILSNNLRVVKKLNSQYD